jgi:hypothetical protein
MKHPQIAMLKKQKCLKKNREKEGKTGPVWGVGTIGGWEYKKRV